MLVVWASLFVLANVGDGVSTYLGLFRLPPETRAEEGNPLFRNIRQHFWLDALVKMGVATGLAVWLYTQHQQFILKFLTIVVLLVVCNNMFIYVARKRTGRKVSIPIKAIFPNSKTLAFFFLIALCCAIAYPLAVVIP